MQKALKVFVCLIAVALIFFDSDTCFAALTDEARLKSYGLYAENYAIDLEVGEDNKIKITEEIDMHFNKEMHGIYRDLPISDSVYYSDDTGVRSFHRYATISDFKSNETFSRSYEDGIYRYKIGNPNELISGDKTYIISYTYDFGEDLADDFDEIYMTLIPKNVKFPTKNVNITVHMPKEFDSEKVFFWSGYWGSGDNELFDYEIEGLTIYGNTNRVIYPGEMVTFRAVLNDGYFVRSKIYEEKPMLLLLYIIPSLMALISGILWIIYGNDRKVKASVRQNAPSGITMAELAIVDHRKLNVFDVNALIYNLAQKGYISIEESCVKDGNFFYIKEREYDETDPIEAKLMKLLFTKKYRASNSQIEKEIATGKFEYNASKVYTSFTKLRGSFGRITKQIINTAEDKIDKDKYFENTKTKAITAAIASVVCFISLCITIVVSSFVPISLRQLAIIIIITATCVFTYVMLNTLKGVARVICTTLLTIYYIVAAITLVVTILRDANLNSFYSGAFIVNIFSLAISIVCLIYMPKRTELGSDYYDQILGFKRNIKDLITNQNRCSSELGINYYYEILPHVMMFNLSSRWVKRFKKDFKSEEVDIPYWYISHSHSRVRIENMTKCIQQTHMNASYGGSSSSGFSVSAGGGFSGGGFGASGGAGGW